MDFGLIIRQASILIIGMGTLSVHAEIKNFEPSFPKYDQNRQYHSAFKVENIGTAKLNNISVPVLGVAVADPTADDDEFYKNYSSCQSQQNCQFKFNIEPAIAKQLKAISLAGFGTILVPADWKVMQSAMGVNGTASTLLMSPKQDEAMTLYNSSACLGCGLPPATLYFPELIKQSLGNDYGAYKDPNKFLTIVKPKKNIAYFSYQIPNYPNKTHGVASYTAGDFNYKEINLTLKPEHKQLAKYILNFYLLTNPIE